MNIFNVRELAEDSNGEYVLGIKDLGTHAVYLIYGFLKAQEDGRKIFPGNGHEEILCVVNGEIIMDGQGETISLTSGEAVHLGEEDQYTLKNNGDETAIYVLAGGHPTKEH